MSDSILSISTGAMQAADAKVRVMMNNIVNAQTPAFRKSDITISSFPTYLQSATNKYERAGMMPKAGPVFQDQTHGAFFKTGGATDLALGGDGYFVLQGADGELFTRDGRLHLDENGRLISSSGNFPVLGYGGPIMVIPGSRLEISKLGIVLVDGVETDRLKLAVFDDPNKLEPVNNSIFKMPQDKPMTYTDELNPRVLQGFLESSNVSIMDEMMNMIYLERTFAVTSKLVQTRDAMLTKAMEMGRPAQ